MYLSPSYCQSSTFKKCIVQSNTRSIKQINRSHSMALTTTSNHILLNFISYHLRPAGSDYSDCKSSSYSDSYEHLHTNHLVRTVCSNCCYSVHNTACVHMCMGFCMCNSFFDMVHVNHRSLHFMLHSSQQT